MNVVSLEMANDFSTTHNDININHFNFLPSVKVELKHEWGKSYYKFKNDDDLDIFEGSKIGLFR